MDNFYASLARRAGLFGLTLLPLTSLLAQNTDTLLIVRKRNPSEARFSVFKSGGLLAGGTYDGGNTSNAIPAEGSGTRLMWYPEKAAFRAGYINGTQWDNANIGIYSTAGGYNARASGDYGTAFGKDVTAANLSSTALGEFCTASGAASVALGYYAHTNTRQGTFVFADRSVVDDGNFATDEAFRAETNHSATWRVTNGFRIYTSSNRSSGIIFQSGTPITGTNSTPSWYQSSAVISTSTGAYLSTSGVWTNVSDRHRKHRFETVAGEDVLARLRQLPITRWSYKVDKHHVRHLGPMAQDFHRAFGLGPDSISIGTVDADGVALAAAQALDARTQQQAARLSALQAENQELRARLDALERRALAATVAATPQSPAPAGLPLAAAVLLAGGGIGAALLRRR
ncbi:tail fiber domain-containing protein [Hymenobacter metallicola]|uniref:Peptidase S74 domain-containing protein n=1 Tax=Hymenobacter metallicola TaxID=2563114 RepID=A0A4Z0QDP8_9BACT|nr:tail fiber domain-containing protein [Hymenobacter metallicola]TGE28177.1 hypothetical protein E5K02_01555 [Hymenobacter metallicola]